MVYLSTSILARVAEVPPPPSPRDAFFGCSSWPVPLCVVCVFDRGRDETGVCVSRGAAGVVRSVLGDVLVLRRCLRYVL